MMTSSTMPSQESMCFIATLDAGFLTSASSVPSGTGSNGRNHQRQVGSNRPKVGLLAELEVHKGSTDARCGEDSD
jgi:hypothetical protein